MSKRKDLIYDSETGDVLDPSAVEGVPAVEPLRVPGIVDRFMENYLPSLDERTATDVLSMGELRTMLSCWFTFGSKEDVLQDYLECLAQHGYILQDTSSGPALCVIRRDSPRVFTPYQEVDEVE